MADCIALAAGGERQCRLAQEVGELCATHDRLLRERGTLATVRGPIEWAGAAEEEGEPGDAPPPAAEPDPTPAPPSPPPPPPAESAPVADFGSLAELWDALPEHSGPSAEPAAEAREPAPPAEDLGEPDIPPEPARFEPTAAAGLVLPSTSGPWTADAAEQAVRNVLSPVVGIVTGRPLTPEEIKNGGPPWAVFLNAKFAEIDPTNPATGVTLWGLGVLVARIENIREKYARKKAPTAPPPPPAAEKKEREAAAAPAASRPRVDPLALDV